MESELLRTQLATYYFEHWHQPWTGTQTGRLEVWRRSHLCCGLLWALLLLRIKRWEMGFSLVPNPDGSRWLDSHREASECRGVDMSFRINTVCYGEGVGPTGGRLEKPQLLTQERRTRWVSFHLSKGQSCRTEHQLDLKHQVRTSKLDPGLPTTQATWTVTESHYGKPSRDWILTQSIMAKEGWSSSVPSKRQTQRGPCSAPFLLCSVWDSSSQNKTAYMQESLPTSANLA